MKPLTHVSLFPLRGQGWMNGVSGLTGFIWVYIPAMGLVTPNSGRAQSKIKQKAVSCFFP